MGVKNIYVLKMNQKNQEIGGIHMDKRISFINEAIDEDVKGVIQHPYFQWLQTQAIDEKNIKLFASQYYIASKGFPSFLANACAHIEDESLRMPFVRNLWDEHGQGDIKKSHRMLFEIFIKAVNADNNQEPLDSTSLYIDTMSSLCSTSNIFFLLGLIGPGVEDITPIEYRIFVKSFENYGCSKEDLVFFHDHIYHDDFHSQDINKSICSALDVENKIEDVILGAKEAIKAEHILWDGLYSQIK
jgi:pyrroloquinoline quinone (PQQ) biosynthesis protein C